MSHSLKRRRFLETACWGGVAATVMPTVTFAQAPTSKRMVFVLLRGAMDGLHAIVPVGDPAYAQTRGRLAYDRQQVQMLDSYFGLAPGLSALMPDYRRGELLAVQGVAIPYRTRSHFDAQSILETGMNRPIGSASGWLNRTLAALGGTDGLGLAVGSGLPKSLYGSAPVATWTPGRGQENVDQFDTALASLYQRDRALSDPFTAAQTLQDQAMSMSMDAGMGSARRGNGQFKQLFKATANFLSAPDGPRVAAIEFSGWDTHANQGLASGSLDRRLGLLAEGLLTLKAGMSTQDWRNTVVVVATEFGRTAASNGNGGTDHGTAGATLLYGGGVSGGRVLADWPGLAANQLFEGRDLRPTLDTRQVLKGVLSSHFDLSANTLNNSVFPDSAGFGALNGLVG